MNQEKLPGKNTSLIMGIIAIVSAITCYCSPIGIITSLIGLVSAYKTKKKYSQNPDAYYEIENVHIGKVLSIIGLILSIVALIPIILYYGIFLAAIDSSSGGFEEILQKTE